MNAAQAVLGLVLLVLITTGSWLAVEAVNRRPALGAILLFAWLSALVLFMEHPELFSRSIAGVNVIVPDVLCAFLGGIAALRFLRGLAPVPRPVLMPLVIFVGTLAISYLRGLSGLGLQRATNEFREFFYFLAALGFTLSFPFEKLGGKVPLIGIGGGVLLVVVALLRLPVVGGFQLEERAIPSYAALAIGQAFFLGWFWLKLRGQSKAIWHWLVFGFLGFSFLMMHRSVWLALGGGILAVMALDRAGRGRLLRTLLIGVAVGSVAAAFLFGDKIVAGLDRAVEEATSSEQSTFIWRLEGWYALLRPDTGWNLLDLGIGRPMGSGYARRLGNSVVNTAEIESGVIPHNYYLSVLLRGGIIGLAAFGILHVRLAKILWRRRREPELSVYAPCFLTILVTQVIYYVPYSADYIQGIFLGGATVLATTSFSRDGLDDPLVHES